MSIIFNVDKKRQDNNNSGGRRGRVATHHSKEKEDSQGLRTSTQERACTAYGQEISCWIISEQDHGLRKNI